LRRYVESDEHLSPRELARLEKAPLSNVSYHVGELFRLEAIVMSGIRPVSGSLQHFYLPADRIKETPWVLETPRLGGLSDGAQERGGKLMGLPSRDLADHFGANLARIRNRADLSQEQLSAVAGLHRTEVGLLERGRRLPRLDTIAKLAGALEVDPGELFAGITWRPAPYAVGAFELSESTIAASPPAEPGG
jgi:DNA-binding XRE family transcriptional regulator